MKSEVPYFILPPYLQQGDTIGITCPAGSVVLNEMEFMFNRLREWNFKIKVGKTVGGSYYKYAATDAERIIDLQGMLDDDAIKAILFGRGGYGMVRIIDHLDFTNFCNNPKWLVGYSDITCIHSHVHTKFHIASIHAHMGAGYKPEEIDQISTRSIQKALTGLRTNYNLDSHPMNRDGNCKAILTGGNLALLSDLIGTPSDINTNGKILVIEDIGEYKYNIDRMMWQLLRAGKLQNLAGLIVGSFNNTMDNEVPFGMTEYEIIWEKIQYFEYPVCFNFKVGHQAENYALKLGAAYELRISDEKVQLIDLSII